jgi:hypothetical protein
MTEMLTMKKGKSVLRRFLFPMILILIVMALLAGFDAILGSFYTFLTPASGREAVALLKGNESVKRTGNYIQHPYMFYTARPNISAFGHEQTNSHGHRSPEVSVSKPPDRLRIMAIGGSTTASYPYVHDPGDTWIAQAARMLEQQTGVHIEYINAGLHAANSADLLAHYVFRNRFFEPDIVVLHLGGNDGLPLHFPDYNPEYTHYTHGWRNSSLNPRPFERQLLKSNIINILYANWLGRIDLEGELGRELITRYSPDKALMYVQQNEPVGFERNLDFLVKNIIDGGGIPVLFPFVYSHGDKMRTGAYREYDESLLLSYEKTIPVMDNIASEYDLRTIRIPDDAISDEDFLDFCHVNLHGETVKAQYVADALKPLVEEWIDHHGVSL